MEGPLPRAPTSAAVPFLLLPCFSFSFLSASFRSATTQLSMSFTSALLIEPSAVRSSCFTIRW